MDGLYSCCFLLFFAFYFFFFFMEFLLFSVLSAGIRLARQGKKTREAIIQGYGWERLGKGLI
ncbi:uncharacterized protein TRIVIDRAFT_187645, partial [Trichoderma virens Gv29-8]